MPFRCRLAQLIAPFRLRLVSALALAVAACALGVLLPLVVQWLLVAADASGPAEALILPGVLLLAAAILHALTASANAWLLGGVAIDLVRDLRLRLYARLQRLPVSWYDRTPAGAVISRVMDDVGAVQNLASGQTLVTIIELATALGAAAWLGMQSWRLAACLALIVPVYWLVFQLFCRPIHAGTLAVRGQLDEVFGQLKQKIDGVLVVRATAREAAETAAFTRQIADLHAPRMLVNRLGIAFATLCGTIGGLGAVAIFSVGTYEVQAGRLSLGGLIAASAMAGLLFAPITRLAELATQFQHARASFVRLGEILDFPLPPTDLTSARSAVDDSSGVVRFEAVGFQYQPGQPVLKRVRLEIPAGQRVAIVGPTGSGKTTLINLLLRFYEPTSGCIRLGGRRLDEIPLAALRDTIGLVPQDPVVFRGTLADNIRYGMPHATDDQVEAAARAALVHDLALSLPQQYDTLVGEGGHPLSQGERQRIAIARLFCKNPAIVVLDEATSSLDAASEALVQRALDRLLAGRTTFVIAHRLGTVQAADRILVMDGGQIVQDGPHYELLTDEEGLYRRLYEAQFGRQEHPGTPGPQLPNSPQPLDAEPHLEPAAA